MLALAKLLKKGGHSVDCPMPQHLVGKLGEELSSLVTEVWRLIESRTKFKV